MSETNGAAKIAAPARIPLEVGRRNRATGSTRQFRITAQRPDGKKGDFGKLGMSAGARAVTSVRLE